MTDVRLRVGVASRGGHGKVEGSAEWRVGKTVVTAFVKGPEITPPATMMPSSGSLGLDATVQVKSIVKPVVGQAGERESGIEDAVVKFVLGSLDLSFPPRTVLTIFIQVGMHGLYLRDRCAIRPCITYFRARARADVSLTDQMARPFRYCPRMDLWKPPY